MKKSPPLLAAGLFAYALMHQTLFCAACSGAALKRARITEKAEQEYSYISKAENHATWCLTVNASQSGYRSASLAHLTKPILR